MTTTIQPQRVGDPGWFQITEAKDGHVWGYVMVSRIPGECCRECGMIRLKVGTAGSCKGRPEVTLR